MTRPLRLDLPDAIHHVTARGNARELVYRDETDRMSWQEILSSIAARLGWLVLAYCQMGNHHHLLVETPQPNLLRGMRQLNGVYAQRFNRRHGRVGHVFQSRFHATLVERGEHLLAVSSYVPLNPVRAGLCEVPANWRWSSYRATIGLESPGFLAVDRLLGFFGDTRERARERYRAYVEAHVEDSLAAMLDRSVILGSDDFAKVLTAGLNTKGEVARRHWQPVRPSLEALLDPPTNAAIAGAYSEYGLHDGPDRLPSGRPLRHDQPPHSQARVRAVGSQDLTPVTPRRPAARREVGPSIRKDE